MPTASTTNTKVKPQPRTQRPQILPRRLFTQGSIKERRFAAAYGKRGRIVAAVTFNHAKWLEHYATQIERSAAFPPPPTGFDRPQDMKPVPAEFPDPHVPTSLPTVILTGHDPNERAAEFRARLH